jgi:integrase
VFPRRDGGRFTATNVRSRAFTAWKDAGLQPITLHECRHSFASLMIGSRVNAKAHLMEGSRTRRLRERTPTSVGHSEAQ